MQSFTERLSNKNYFITPEELLAFQASPSEEVRLLAFTLGRCRETREHTLKELAAIQDSLYPHNRMGL